MNLVATALPCSAKPPEQRHSDQLFTAVYFSPPQKNTNEIKRYYDITHYVITMCTFVCLKQIFTFAQMLL
jgi:hypothetical protein